MCIASILLFPLLCKKESNHCSLYREKFKFLSFLKVSLVAVLSDLEVNYSDED